MSSNQTDSFGRTVDYLRISITDRCNERCLYCMPEGYKGWERTQEHLTVAEIIQIVGVAARLRSWAGPLRAAGLRTANVSLDALDPKIYRQITGGDIELVFAGIRAAIA